MSESPYSQYTVPHVYSSPPREPVKLSRERWEMLRQCPLPSGKVATEIRNWLKPIRIDTPTEIEGVIFLPAEYVLDPLAVQAERDLQAMSWAGPLEIIERNTLYGTPPR